MFHVLLFWKLPYTEDAEKMHYVICDYITGHVCSLKYLYYTHTSQTLLLYFYDQIDKSWTWTIIQVLFLLLDSNACWWNVLTVHRIANVSFSISCLRKYYSLRRITQVMQHWVQFYTLQITVVTYLWFICHNFMQIEHWKWLWSRWQAAFPLIVTFTNNS